MQPNVQGMISNSSNDIVQVAYYACLCAVQLCTCVKCV